MTDHPTPVEPKGCWLQGPEKHVPFHGGTRLCHSGLGPGWVSAGQLHDQCSRVTVTPTLRGWEWVPCSREVLSLFHRLSYFSLFPSGSQKRASTPQQNDGFVPQGLSPLERGRRVIYVAVGCIPHSGRATPGSWQGTEGGGGGQAHFDISLITYCTIRSI